MNRSPNQSDIQCSQIPIRYVNYTQSFGVLIAIEKKSRTISHISENVEVGFGVEGQSLLGKSIFSPDLCPQLNIIADLLHAKNKKLSTVEPVYKDEHNELIYHKLDKYHLFEWLFFEQKNEEELPERYQKMTILFEELRKKGFNDSVCQVICEELKSIFSFDKVLIYRFRADGHGEVIGEAKEEEMDPYLGLRFPASDIPPQVREVYLANPLRLIQNVQEKPVSILSLPGLSALDLTDCLLKGVAQVHQDYVKAMNIATSLSFGLIVQGKLWGLLCYHSIIPKQLPYQDRFLLNLFAELFGMLLEIREDTTKLNLGLEVKNKLLALAHFEDVKLRDFIDIFVSYSEQLLNILNADGCCICYNEKTKVSGKTPPLEFIEGLIEWLDKGPLKNDVFFTDCLVEQYPPAKEYIDSSAGIMAYRISPIPKQMIIWFRSDQMSKVYWAGNPKSEQVLDLRAGLNPQRSFSLFVETVLDKSILWLPDEILTAKEIQDFMKKVIIERLYVENKIIEGEVLQFQLAVDTVDNGIFVLSEEKKILWCNQYFAQFFQDQGDIRGQDFISVLRKSKADYFFPDLNEPQVKQWEHEVGFGDNQKRFLMLHINLYLIELIEQKRYIGVVYDITNLKETTEVLKNLNKQKDNFLQMAAHDLRNPLASILMAASILKSQDVEPSTVKQLNEIIERQGRSMLTLLNELVDASEIQSLEMHINEERTDLKQFFENIRVSNEILFEAKGIYLVKDFQIDIQETYIDQNKIKQVVENLLSNAIKYSSPATTVTFKVYARENQLKVEVDDQGVGIPLKEQDRIFVPHSKLSPKPTGNERSHGVGLSICKRIINRLGGEMDFTSTPNKGSQFYFSLPLKSITSDF